MLTRLSFSPSARPKAQSCKGGVLIKVDVVLVAMIMVLHDQVVQLLRGRSDYIGFAECGRQDLFECWPCQGVVRKAFLVE